MSADPVVVTHVLGSYPVYIEPGALSRLEELVRQHLPGRQVVLIADEVVYGLYRAGRFGRAPSELQTITFPSGEKFKTRESWAQLTDTLVQRGFGRDTGVVALGGGVTGDLAGFVAATYMRGVPYLQVPTTLLAMLDASVGGKTGVDMPQGKNLVGAFHPPAAVLADPCALVTLPEREYRSGLAEAVKHGLIADGAYFAWMEANAAGLSSRDLPTLTQLIRRSVEIKAEVVAGDEREAGRRAILNAGHTVAHAVEQVSSYEVTHGEAVALGLIAECELAEQLGIASAGVRRRVAGLLGRLGLPERFPAGLERSLLLETMGRDKKNRGGQIHFALVKRLGEMHRENGWTTAVAEDAIRAAMAVLR
jgi:3-dehydroquinate synthase